VVREIMEVVIEGSEMELVEIIKKMKKAGVKPLKDNKWEIEGELVLKEGKIYMLKDKKLRMEVIQ